jgi:multidrug efflux pump subunit AcrA (membrane-fusion protein)
MRNMRIAVLLAVVAALFVVAACDKPAATGDHDPSHAGETQLYTCPMHPQIIEEEPGTCPICKMDLVPVKQEAAEPDAPKTTIAVASGTVQKMSVRIDEVKRTSITRGVRTVGEIDVAEDAISVVNLRYSGWIERIFVDQTGAKVKRGQPLFRIYSPELVQAQVEFLQAFQAEGPASPVTKSARTRLDLLGVGSWLADTVAKQGEVVRSVTIPAPRGGFVLHKNVVQGSKVMAGADLYRIGNLESIWVNVEIYEFDAPWIKTGQAARMELPFQKGKTYAGKVGYVYPTLDPQTRTLRARLEFPNPGLNLKPGMFATVWVDVETKPDVLTLPTEAILRSGERQLVFVALGDGKFQPRRIVTGLTGDGHVTEVLSGVEAGENVVTSGQFMLDSESQLQEAVQKLLAEKHRH